MRYVPNPNFEGELAAEPGVRRELAATARRAAKAAAASAPSRRLARHMRADGNRLENTYAGALAMEFGTAHTPMSASMRRAAMAVGATVEDSRRG